MTPTKISYALTSMESSVTCRATPWFGPKPQRGGLHVSTGSHVWRCDGNRGDGACRDLVNSRRHHASGSYADTGKNSIGCSNRSRCGRAGDASCEAWRESIIANLWLLKTSYLLAPLNF